MLHNLPVFSELLSICNWYQIPTYKYQNEIKKVNFIIFLNVVWKFSPTEVAEERHL